MRFVKTLWWILTKDLRQRVRDRSGLVVALVVPLAMAFLIGTALEQANEGVVLELGLVAADDAQADAFTRWLEQPWIGDDLVVTRFESEDAARGGIDEDRVWLALVLSDDAARVVTPKRFVNETRIVQGLAEALHFAKATGQDASAVLDVISKGAAQSWQMDNRGETMLANEFEFGFAVDWMRKDLAIILDQARDAGVQLPVTTLVDQFYAEVQKLGGNRWDTSSLIVPLERIRADSV